MSRNIEEEILKNSKYAKFFYSNDVEANKSKLNISNNKQNEQSLKNEDLNCSTNLKKQIEDKKLDESFKKLRQNNPQVLADFEAEEYIQNLRDIGEYNRWSLRLVQKWLTGFYTDKFWVKMGLAMMKYNKELNSEDIHLDICNEFLEGYYFFKENKITLCSNTLTNFEKPKKFHMALKRHVHYNFINYF